MPKFKNREEYEEWKNEKIRSNLEKSSTAEKEEGEEARTETARPETAAKQPILAKEDLRPLGELFSDSWEIFRRRFLTLFPLHLFSVLSFLVMLGIFVGIGYALSLLFAEIRYTAVAAGVVVGLLPAFLAMFWCMSAFIFAVADEQLAIKDALARGWGNVFSFMWLMSVLGFVVTGGFLLFLIPGVIFVVWFSFAQFVLVSEGDRGMDALLKSKEYVRDRWFDVCLRLFVIWFISGSVNMIPIAGPIVSFLFFPFVMIFTYLIYQDLVSLKGKGITYPHSFGEKCKWIGAGTLGYIVFPVVVITFFIAIFGASLLTIPPLLLKEILQR
ncbi:MAG: hypothetical protein LUO89_16150 [Methanothrix sp.]|nr:hypothetical protein [Methanothrix sp.]